MVGNTMQRNTSIYTLIALAFLTHLAYFFAYATNTIVSRMLDADPIETIPAFEEGPDRRYNEFRFHLGIERTASIRDKRPNKIKDYLLLQPSPLEE